MPPTAIITIVPTGAANLASVFAAFARLGAAPTLAQSPRDITSAAALILPGVGAFAAAMRSLRDRDFIAPLQDRFAAGAPTLAICLGLQLLCESSEESPGVSGLGVIRAPIRRFPNIARTPQMGWNTVTPNTECALLQPGDAYFANSYRLLDPPDTWSVATTDHAGPFISACERGATLACQFHPELSGAWGRALISRWLTRALSPTEALPC